jgi:hypothetical protein
MGVCKRCDFIGVRGESVIGVRNGFEEISHFLTSAFLVDGEWLRWAA